MKNNLININRFIFLLLILPLLSACVRTMTTPATEELENVEWSDYLVNSGLINDKDSETRWWMRYQDEGLNKLIELALQDNLDLKIARSKIRQARAEYRNQLSALAPQLGASGSLSEQQLSETGSIPAGRIPGFEIRQTIYQAGFDAAWEIDLLGRNPKRRAIAESRYQNQLELQHDLHLSVAAEVTRSYLTLRVLQAQKKAMLDRVDLQRRISEAVQTQQQYGEATVSDVEQANALKAEYQALLPVINTQIRSLIYQISVLSGSPPDALSANLMAAGKLPGDVTNSLGNISSKLLRRRADVRYAERQYVIAVQQQQLAKLAIYPTFSLFGNAGPNTVDFSGFSDDESLAFNFGGLIHWPLYSGGQLRAQSKIAGELSKQAEYAYTNTVLNALKDVESIGVRLVESKREFKTREIARTAHRRVSDNMQQRYKAGTINLVTWLNAEQQVRLSQIMLLGTQSQLLQHSVALHKALGGGWLLLDHKQNVSDPKSTN